MMHRCLKPILLAALVAVSAASVPAWAHRGHFGHGRVGVGVVIGAPWVWPGYYSPYYAPYYAYPAPVVVQSSPPTYIEQGDTYSAEPREEAYWYYCRKSKGYYPYVNECPGGWQRVAPRPSSEQ